MKLSLWRFTIQRRSTSFKSTTSCSLKHVTLRALFSIKSMNKIGTALENYLFTSRGSLAFALIRKCAFRLILILINSTLCLSSPSPKSNSIKFFTCPFTTGSPYFPFTLWSSSTLPFFLILREQNQYASSECLCRTFETTEANGSSHSASRRLI